MEANGRTFRHPFIRLVPMFLVILFLGVLAFSIEQMRYFLLILVGIYIVSTLFYATGRVKISNDEITTSGLLGSKSLRWSEIARVSTRGQALRLHSYDQDLMLSIDPQLEGYKEIVDIVFSKRSDLVDNSENTVLSSNWLVNIFVLAFGLFIIAISVFALSVSEEVEKIFSLIFFALGVAVVVIWFFLPRSLVLEGKNLIVRYLFKEESYSINEIGSISLEKRNTKDGYMYFVQINLKSGKRIKLPAFKQGAPLTYQILKRWHEKAIST